MCEALTADVAAGLELGGHLRVHRDHDLLLLGHDGVALFDLIADPFFELLAHDYSANVDNPLLWHFLQVWLIRQVHLDPRLVANERQDLLDGEVLVLRHVQRLNSVVLDVCFLARDDVLQEVNGHIVCKKDDFDQQTRQIKFKCQAHLPYGGRYTSHSPARKLKHSRLLLNLAANSFAET